MSRKKGKFLDKSSAVSGDDQVGLLTIPGAEVIEVQEETWGSIFWGWFKGIVGFALLLALIGAGLFTALGITLMTFSNVGSEDDTRSIVIRGAWAEAGGKPPIGTEIAVSHTTPAPTGNWWDWVPIAWVGINNTSKMEVVSTDYADLYISGTLENANVTLLSDPNVTGPLDNVKGLPFADRYEDGQTFEQNFKLKDAYLVECISGVCVPGELYVMRDNYIYGEVR